MNQIELLAQAEACLNDAGLPSYNDVLFAARATISEVRWHEAERLLVLRGMGSHNVGQAEQLISGAADIETRVGNTIRLA